MTEGNCDILLVEDNPGDVLLIQEAFKDGKLKNSSLCVVKDGEEALQFLRHEPPYNSSRRPDLILLDLNLPRKDGREVLREVKSDPELCDIPILILTTSRDEQDIHHAYKLHANCYLNKPVDMEEFIDVVRGIDQFWLSLVRLPSQPGPEDHRA